MFSESASGAHLIREQSFLQLISTNTYLHSSLQSSSVPSAKAARRHSTSRRRNCLLVLESLRQSSRGRMMNSLNRGPSAIQEWANVDHPTGKRPFSCLMLHFLLTSPTQLVSGKQATTHYKRRRFSRIHFHGRNASYPSFAITKRHTLIRRHRETASYCGDAARAHEERDERL